MSDSNYTRRNALAALAIGSAALATSQSSSAIGQSGAKPQKSPAAPPGGRATAMAALAGNHSVIALPFAPGSLNGISERLITSHHDNNYAGAVKNLNRVELELTRISADTPPFVVAALREKELTFRNSKALHEAYFGNLGGNGKRTGASDVVLSHAYGSAARWEEQFRATCLGLGGGSGWVLLNYELETGQLRTCAASNHTQLQALSVPLLVCDLYEHAYQMDYGAAVAKYIDAFFANVKWDEVNRRLELAQRASAILRATS